MVRVKDSFPNYFGMNPFLAPTSFRWKHITLKIHIKLNLRLGYDHINGEFPYTFEECPYLQITENKKVRVCIGHTLTSRKFIYSL